MPNDDVTRIHAAIRSAHGCEAKHIGTHQENDGIDGVRWEGNVEVFELLGLSPARYCYGWIEPNGDVTTVLQIPPVISPLTAVHTVLKRRRELGRTPDGV